jgi:hypothetical protein
MHFRSSALLLGFFVGCTGDGLSPADAAPDAFPVFGALTARFRITVGGTESSCAATAGTMGTVLIAATSAAGAVVTNQFFCTDLPVATYGGLPGGTYTVDVQLLDANGHLLADDPIGPVEVGPGITDLGVIVFALPATRGRGQ